MVSEDPKGLSDDSASFYINIYLFIEICNTHIAG